MHIRHTSHHPVFDEVLGAGMSFECHPDHVGLSGFSKAGIIRLIYDYEKKALIAHTRYGETEVIENFDDLVALSWKWWQRYEDRGYTCPEEFKPHFIRLGYMKVENKTVETIVKLK